MNLNVNWSTIWTAIGALATVATLCFTIVSIVRRKRVKRLKIVLSMQMSHLSQQEYSETRQDIMTLIYDLRKRHDVFFFNEFVPTLTEFDEKKFDPHKYLHEIDKCNYFVAIILERVPSSIYFEAGYALAAGKRSIYYVTDEKAMPILMRTASTDHSKIKLIRATGLEDIKPRILSLFRNSHGDT